MCTFSVNASPVGGMEQSFTDDAPLFPVFERHMLTLHSVMELHDPAVICPAVQTLLVQNMPSQSSVLKIICPIL